MPNWVAADFARRILSFSTLHRAGLVVLVKEAASDGFSAKKLQEIFDCGAEVRFVGTDASWADHLGRSGCGGWFGPAGDRSVAGCGTRRGGSGVGFVETGSAPSVPCRGIRGRSTALGGGVVGAYRGRTSRGVGGAAPKNGLPMSGVVPTRVGGTAKTVLLGLIDNAVAAGWTHSRVCMV